MNNLSNKVAIVTGAAQGIGRAIAERLASNGAHVVVADIQVEKGEQVAEQIRTAGGNATLSSTFPRSMAWPPNPATLSTPQPRPA